MRAKVKKRLACRLGFHAVFNDTTGENVGTSAVPIYIMQTYKCCNYCDWTTQPRKEADGSDGR